MGGHGRECLQAPSFQPLAWWCQVEADCRRVWSHHHAVRGLECAHVPRIRPAFGGGEGCGHQECRWNTFGRQLRNELQSGSKSPNRAEQLLVDQELKAEEAALAM